MIVWRFIGDAQVVLMVNEKNDSITLDPANERVIKAADVFIMLDDIYHSSSSEEMGEKLRSYMLQVSPLNEKEEE